MPTHPISFSVDCDRQLVASEVSSQRMVEWIVTVPAEQPRIKRAPLNLALVLDRSGSMRGDKLYAVQRAACHVLDLLDERDRVAIIAYDDQMTVIAPSESVTEHTRTTLKRHINSLQPGRQTNLSGGWLTGCREVAKQHMPDGINRALLLTDGLANCGIIDVEVLMQHAHELRQRGVSTATFGVGLDFNEHLLEALAEQGGGRFYYIDRSDRIPEIFRQELNELLTVVAREAFLSITIPSGVAVELIGDLPHQRDGNHLRIFLGDLGAGEGRNLYARVLTPPDAPGTRVLLRAELSYANLDGQTESVSTAIAFSYTREAEVLLAPVYEALLQRGSAVEMAAVTNRALKLERQGQHQQGQALVREALAANASRMTAATAADYEAIAAQMERGLSEDQRKATHFANYQKRQSRTR